MTVSLSLHLIRFQRVILILTGYRYFQALEQRKIVGIETIAKAD